WNSRSSSAERCLRLGGVAVGCFDGCIEIGKNIADIFDADRQAYQFRSDAGIVLLLRVELRVGGRCRMNDQRFRVANIRQQREELERIDQGFAGLKPTL